MTMHFLALRRINRTAWGTKLPPTVDLARPVYCISPCHILKASERETANQVSLHGLTGSMQKVKQ